MAVDTDKLNAFLGQFVGDLGAAVHAGMVVIGERLGLYKALAASPVTSAELASKTQTDERYVREWLSSQAAGGYVNYDDKTNNSASAKSRPLPWPTKAVRPIFPERSNWLSDRWQLFHASPTRFAMELAWDGTSTTTASSTAARSFSGRDTRRIW
jgi:hypothetical protein